MSENISILEGGQAKVFGHVQKLKIANSGGGSSLWVPEEAVPTGSLYVDKNGTYYASSEGYFGYDEVEVNIVKSVKGKKNNKPYDVTVDDDGFLHENELPAYIEITTPPTTLNYVDGQDISTEGWVVKAFYTDGTEWGDISDTAMIDPTVADITKADEMYTDGDGVNALKITYTKHQNKWSYNGRIYTDYASNKALGHNYPDQHGNCDVTLGGDGPGEYLVTKYGGDLYVKRLSGGWRGDLYGIHPSPLKSGSSTYTAIGEDSVYIITGGAPGFDAHDNFFGWVWGEYFTELPKSTKNPSRAGTMVRTDSGQKITVNWDREDGEVLSTSFIISVGIGPIPPAPENNGGGGR